MTGLGLAATAAAYLNYQNAKRNYEQIKERSAGVNAVINRYQQILDEWDYQKSVENSPEIVVEKNDHPEGLLVGTLLRVGNLVGKIMRAEPTIVISNTSNKKYYLFYISIQQFVLDRPVTLFDLKGTEMRKFAYIKQWIKPGQTIEIPLAKALTTLVTENGDVMLGELRNAICEAAGKKLITSCPKINLDGVEKADIVLYWADQDTPAWMFSGVHDLKLDAYLEKNPGVLKKAWWLGLPGTLRYCGEAYL